MKKVSFCIPCYKSEQTLTKVVDEIRTSMEEISDKYEYEIILVNDASPDGTFNVISKLVDTYPNITGIDLAKNFGQHAALMAGFAHVTGDILVCLDDDGQTPANEVGKLLDKGAERLDGKVDVAVVSFHLLIVDSVADSESGHVSRFGGLDCRSAVVPLGDDCVCYCEFNHITHPFCLAAIKYLC